LVTEKSLSKISKIFDKVIKRNKELENLEFNKQQMVIKKHYCNKISYDGWNPSNHNNSRLIEYKCEINDIVFNFKNNQV